MTARAATPGQEVGAHPRVAAAPIVTRFAPSPTGRLHLGHAVSAILAHDMARQAGGSFLLRIEDIDMTRTRDEHLAAIVADLTWLGLTWDGTSRQSERGALHADGLERLKERGLVYPCFCTRAEIAASASAPHGDEGPIYPGTCRRLAAPDLSRAHCWRLDVGAALAIAGPLAFVDNDRVVAAHPADAGDVVLARKDVGTSYHLAVTVDDAAQGVSDVVRGCDLFTATHLHRLLQALLDLPTPRYHHHPLVLGRDGRRLAKRHGAPALSAMREAGDDGRELARGLREGMLPIGFSRSKD